MSNKIHLLAFGLVLALAALCRFWAAPISAGPDVCQFWAFANVFQIHGLDFYRYAEGTAAIFPFKGWGFVYPPVWLLLLGLALIFVPESTATATMVDSGWRLAMKTPIIAADLAIGCLLYLAVPGSRLRKLLFACLWLFHPTAWYESAVFGQFDAVAASFLLAAVILLERGRDRLAFLLAGLAVMTKQHTLVPIAVMAVIFARQLPWRRLVTNLAIFAGVVIVFSAPFLLTGNFSAYARSLFLPGQAPTYQVPLVYAFSGIGSLLTYLHETLGWATSGLLPFTIPIMFIAIAAVMVLSYRRAITPAQGALAGFLVLISFLYRVNYQYLIIYIPLALLVAAQTRYRGERFLALALALLPAVWLWFASISCWFNFPHPASTQVNLILARIGLAHSPLPDYVFVSLALAIMGLSIAYVVCLFTRWHNQKGGAMQPALPPSKAAPLKISQKGGGAKTLFTTPP
jgi:hypothetical protein